MPALGAGDAAHAADAAVLSTLQTTTLQDFSRRTGVSYADVFSIVGTRFINPRAG